MPCARIVATASFNLTEWNLILTQYQRVFVAKVGPLTYPHVIANLERVFRSHTVSVSTHWPRATIVATAFFELTKQRCIPSNEFWLRRLVHWLVIANLECLLLSLLHFFYPVSIQICAKPSWCQQVWSGLVFWEGSQERVWCCSIEVAQRDLAPCALRSRDIISPEVLHWTPRYSLRVTSCRRLFISD